MIYSKYIIVGGGPAGSSFAYELLRNGENSVLLFDRESFPRLKLCAGWITPKVLKDLNLSENEIPGIIKLDNMKIYFKDTFIGLTLKTNQFSIRRTEFDDFLLKRSDVSIVKHNVKNIINNNNQYIIDNTYICDYLIGAGGTHCPVRRTFFKDYNQKNSDNFVLTQEIEYKPNHLINKNAHLWFFYPRKNGYAWYVPKHDAINIGYGYFKDTDDNPKKYWDSFLNLLLKNNLINDISQVPSPKGWSYYTNNGFDNQNGNCYLIGDSLNLATKDMSEGIGPAIESGLMLARKLLGIRSDLKITKYSLPEIHWFPNMISKIMGV